MKRRATRDGVEEEAGATAEVGAEATAEDVGEATLEGGGALEAETGERDIEAIREEAGVQTMRGIEDQE